jgi:flagellar protein FlaI
MAREMSGFNTAMQKFPHLSRYVEGFNAAYGEIPKFYMSLSRGMAVDQYPNILYPVGDPIFVHIFRDPERGKRYIVIEPKMDKDLKARYRRIMDLALREAPMEKSYADDDEFKEIISRILNKVTTIEERKKRGYSRFEADQVRITEEELETVQYYIVRDLIESGILEPILRDPYNEDIHSVGLDRIHVVHKIFGMMETSIHFTNEFELHEYIRNMAERIGKPVSDAVPIVDGAMPDGSRVNIIYSEDVSKQGSSFTIRKFTETPLTFVALVQFGTLSPEIAAYLWLCMENGMSIIVSGETASGKTTTLNGCLTFINHEHKVYSAEDTPEVIAPQPVWQRLVTRPTGPEGSRVELFDLVRAALRSRPNYIVVGETRGVEGNYMFQAMQTGHSVMSTFHAPSTRQLIQRFTGDPINVPIRFIDNLNIALFQQIMYEGGVLIRRVTSVDEILRYSKEMDGVLTRSVFRWDPFTDTHYFRGMNNSYILEEKVAPILKFDDKRDVYKELEMRARVVKEMADRNIVEYERVNRLFRAYYKLKINTLRSIDEKRHWWERALQAA